MGQLPFILAAAFVIVAALLWYLRRHSTSASHHEQCMPSVADHADHGRTVISGSAENWVKVLSGNELLIQCHGQTVIDEIRRQSRLSNEVFGRDLHSALVTYAEFVQLLPASESHHHAHPGGLLAHTLEVVLGAMTLRNGYLLPTGAATELIEQQRDHWTYAIFFAALLHDIGKIMTDVRIQVRDTPKSPVRRWLPLSGAMTQSLACEYRVGFAPTAERDYQAHRKLALVLLHGIVVPNALALLGRESIVLESLTAFLGGEDRSGTDVSDGAKILGQIIKTADQRSVAHNLQHGPRERFASAVAVPLIERMMAAMRSLLAQGTHLPLNRDGAAGWVTDGAIWFVAKRLADAVRAKIQTDEGDEGLPGPSKNDRLFDTWQDFAVLEVNPTTGQAIWHVVVTGEGYQHRLAVLKFALHKIWDDAERYPAPFNGTITVVGKGQESAVAVRQDVSLEASPPQILGDMVNAPATSATTDSPQNIDEVPRSSPGPMQVKEMGPKEPDDADLVEDQSDGRQNAPTPATPLSPPAAAKARYDDIPAPRSGSGKKARPSVQQSSLPVAELAPGLNHCAVPAHLSENGSSPSKATDPAVDTKAITIGEDLLDQEDSASDTPSRRQPRRSTSNPPIQIKAGGPPVAPRAVAPRLPGAKEPTALAVSFMTWIQQGLASGSLAYNEPGAPVHFIAQGMALVSPRIFRDYAAATESNADDVQKQVIGAGWHIKASGNSNILHFAVNKRDGVRAGKLAAVVIQHPERWVNPLPPDNASIVPFALSVDAIGKRSTAGSPG